MRRLPFARIMKLSQRAVAGREDVLRLGTPAEARWSCETPAMGIGLGGTGESVRGEWDTGRSVSGPGGVVLHVAGDWEDGAVASRPGAVASAGP